MPAILDEYKARLKPRVSAYNQQVGQRDALLHQKEMTDGILTDLSERTAANQRVLVVCQKTSQTARDRMRVQVESLITMILRAVYGPDYTFEIEMTEVGARPAAEFYVSSPMEGKIMRNKPQDSRGGGVRDVIALGARLSYMRLCGDPAVAPVLILDEPLVAVSVDHAPDVTQALQWICATFGIQVIMVTHNEDYAMSANRSFQVSIEDGISSLLEIEGGTMLL